MNTVLVFPHFCPLNQSFFLEGLRTVFGARHILYSTRGFPVFKRSGHLKCIVHGSRESRLFIDHWDSPVFDDEGLAWSDVYAKRNIDPDRIPTPQSRKIIATGPSFPLRIDDSAASLYDALKTWILSAQVAPSGRFDYAKTKEHFAGWYRQTRYGLEHDAYTPGTSKSDYVFFSSSIWKYEADTNRVRAHFIEACRSLGDVQFEGGFTPRSANDVRGFEHLTVGRRYSHDEFLGKTKVSAVVFNNPAVERAFSWRLGEALALGKAIISTPLERLVPAPLVHGEHIHFVDPTFESIQAAVRQLCENEGYRRKLEQGARQYYLDHVSPAAAIRRAVLTAEQAVM